MNLSKRSSSMSNDHKLAFWPAAVIGLVWTVSIVFQYFPPFQAKTRIESYILVTAGLSSIAWLFSILSILWGKTIRAALIIIISTWFTAFGMMSLSEGNTFSIVAISMMISLYFAVLLIPGKILGKVILFSGLIGALMIISDLFWPFSRTAGNPAGHVFGYIVSGILTVVMLVLFLGRLPDYSLRAKLIAAMLVIAGIPNLAFGLASANSNRTNITASANQSLLTAASQTSTALDTFFRNTLDSIRIEAQFSSIEEFASASNEKNLNEKQSKNSLDTLAVLSRKDPAYIRSYALLDNSGTILTSTDPNEIGANFFDFDHFQQAKSTGEPTSSSIHFDNSAGEPFLFFIAPVRDSSGNISGAIQLKYDAAVLNQVVKASTSSLGSDTSAVLLDDHQVILAHSSAPEEIYTVLPSNDSDNVKLLQEQGSLPAGDPEKIFNNLNRLQTGIANLSVTPFFSTEVHKDAAGHNELAAAVQLSTKPWTMVITQPEELLLAPLNRQNTINTIISLLIAIVTVGVALLFAGYIVRPIDGLADAARQVASGNLTATFPVRNQDEIGVLGGIFNSMTTQLRTLVGSLEQRVADRTKALTTASDISRRLSTILDQSELVREVVSQMQSAFGYYHVHIYLLDKENENLEMAGGTGLPGEIMLARRHSIPRGRGLVGRAAENNNLILVQDVTQEAGWLPNPLLPETLSEVAVPIAIGSEVLGVLDVQHNVVDGLRQEDADLIQAIANQVAVALRNARVYAQIQYRAEREALAATISKRIQSTTNISDALKIAARELGRVMDKRPTRVRLVTKQAEDGQN